jgi:hypothetical protein
MKTMYDSIDELSNKYMVDGGNINGIFEEYIGDSSIIVMEIEPGSQLPKDLETSINGHPIYVRPRRQFVAQDSSEN